MLLCLRPPNIVAKGIFGRVRTGCKEKRTGRANFVLFRLLIGLIAVTVAFVVAPRIYPMCVNSHRLRTVYSDDQNPNTCE